MSLALVLGTVLLSISGGESTARSRQLEDSSAVILLAFQADAGKMRSVEEIARELVKPPRPPATLAGSVRVVPAGKGLRVEVRGPDGESAGSWETPTQELSERTLQQIIATLKRAAQLSSLQDAEVHVAADERVRFKPIKDLMLALGARNLIFALLKE